MIINKKMKLNLIITPKDKKLQKYTNQLKQNWDLLESIIINMYSLCNINNFSDNIPINLIYGKNNEEIFAWFSWTPKNSSITIEFSKSSKPEKGFLIIVLIHEIFHLMLRKNKKLMQKISEYSESNKSILKKIKEKELPFRIILEELIISSFIPEGYLSKKYFNKQIKKTPNKFLHNDLIDWRKYIAYKMQKYAKLYFDKKQTIDDAYINKIIDLIKKQ